MITFCFISYIITIIIDTIKRSLRRKTDEQRLCLPCDSYSRHLASDNVSHRSPTMTTTTTTNDDDNVQWNPRGGSYKLTVIIPSFILSPLSLFYASLSHTRSRLTIILFPEEMSGVASKAQLHDYGHDI